MELLLIADDLTGTNDTAIHFVHQGLSVEIILDMKYKLTSSNLNNNVIAINTNSRAFRPQDAKQVIKDIHKNISHLEKDYILFKKIDSTLRGNVGAELESALHENTSNLVLLAPGIPSAGREVIDGICYVNSIPLVETEFATDPKTPISYSLINDIINSQTDIQTINLTLDTIQKGKDEVIKFLKPLIASKKEIIVVCDTKIDSDLNTIVQAGLSYPHQQIIYSGASGIANALSTNLFQKQEKNILGVIGSMSKQSFEQLEYAKNNLDIKILDIYPEQLLELGQDTYIDTIIKQTTHYFVNDNICMFRTMRNLDERHKINEIIDQYSITSADLGDLLALFVGTLFNRLNYLYNFKGIYLTGGDMALAVAQSFKATSFLLKDQVEPNIPYGYFNTVPGVPIVTKAGGFGTEKALYNVINFFNNLKIQ